MAFLQYSADTSIHERMNGTEAKIHATDTIFDSDSNGASNSAQNPESIQEDPIVIIGMSLRFPQDAVSVETFWQMLMEGRSAGSSIPKDRYNVDAFYSPGVSKTGLVRRQLLHLHQPLMYDRSTLKLDTSFETTLLRLMRHSSQ